MRKVIALILALALLVALLCACAPQTSTPGAEGTGAPAPDGEKSSAAPKDGEKTKITLWWWDGNPVADPLYEETIALFEEKYPQYDVEYIGLPNDSYYQKYTTAFATGEVPDVIGTNSTNILGLMEMGGFVELSDIYEGWDEKDNMDPMLMDTARGVTTDGSLYLMPMYCNCYNAWYNTTWHTENGETVPETISEYMALCEKYADSANGKYYTSLRGGAGGIDNIWCFIMTYAGLTELFDAEGNCMLTDPKCAEALDLYASIYWNGWCSKDSVTNGFKEIVAEYGSKTTQYLTHNNSSLPEHKKNLGEGNFMSAPILKNDDGTSVTPAWAAIGFSIPEDAKNKEGATELLKFLCSAEGSAIVCEGEGRIPANKVVQGQEWFTSSPYNKAYMEMLADEKLSIVPYPLWLPSWTEFKTSVQEPGFQALLLKEKTSEQVLAEWAEFLSKGQKEFLAQNK